MTTPTPTRTSGERGCPAYIVFPGEPGKRHYCFLPQGHIHQDGTEHCAYIDEEQGDFGHGMKWLGAVE